VQARVALLPNTATQGEYFQTENLGAARLKMALKW
jgi:hypothetical protein